MGWVWRTFVLRFVLTRLARRVPAGPGGVLVVLCLFLLRRHLLGPGHVRR